MPSQTVIQVRGQYPTRLPYPHEAELIPPGCTIYHGADLLSGSQVLEAGRTWAGEPTLLGCFYAAVDAGDPHAAELRDENLANGAVVIEYVTDDQVRQALMKHWAEALNAPDLAAQFKDADMDYVWGHYVFARLHHRREPVPA